MIAEIGFARDWTGDIHRPDFGAMTDRLNLVIRSQSITEQTLLIVFAKRMGLTFDPCAGELTIAEPTVARADHQSPGPYIESASP